MSIFDKDMDARVRPAVEASVPGVLLGYHLVASYIDKDGDEVIVMSAPETQRATLSGELLRVGTEALNVIVARQMSRIMDSDEQGAQDA